MKLLAIHHTIARISSTKMKLKRITDLFHRLFPLLFLTSPVVAMWKTNTFQIGGKRWNDKKYEVIRGLRRFFQLIEMLPLLRLVALSRTDFNRERTLVLPRWCALSRLAVSATMVVLNFEKVSNSPVLSSFLLIMCIDAPESTTTSRSSALFEMGANNTPASIS